MNSWLDAVSIISFTPANLGPIQHPYANDAHPTRESSPHLGGLELRHCQLCGHCEIKLH
jgi:hypothetical protein